MRCGYVETGVRTVLAEAKAYLAARGLTANWERPHEAVGDLFASHDPARPLVEWYARSDVSAQYVAALASWHHNAPGPTLYSHALVYHGRGPRVLEIGGGIGTATIAMATAGYDVEFCEPGAVLHDFARQRFEDRGLAVHMVAKPSQGPWNMIVALDVVEHLDDPASLLRWAHGQLADDGVIALTWTFYRDRANPMHIDHADPRATQFYAELKRLFKPKDQAAAIHLDTWPSFHEKA